ncbi:hypothetical protein EJ07DRAFT_158643 [Lizonia empirigonia]|nr:hypothetical protein EJ07DRAFT_158643 [Lizonia empirigonia]
MVTTLIKSQNSTKTQDSGEHFDQGLARSGFISVKTPALQRFHHRSIPWRTFCSIQSDLTGIDSSIVGAADGAAEQLIPADVSATDQNRHLVAFLKDLGEESRGAQKQKIEDHLDAIEEDSHALTPAAVTNLQRSWIEGAGSTHRFVKTNPAVGPSKLVVPPSLPPMATLTTAPLQCDSSFPNCPPCLSRERSSVEECAHPKPSDNSRKRFHGELRMHPTTFERSHAFLEALSNGQHQRSDNPIRKKMFVYSQAFASDHHFASSRYAPSRTLLTSKYEDPDYIFEELWQEPREIHGEDSTIAYLTSSALPISRWTTVYKDEKLLNHLLLLFWTWDTTANRVIDWALFEDALKHSDPSDQDSLRFCSPFLVNAVFTLACLYTTHDATFHTPGDPLTRGAAFAREAERLLVIEEKSPSLPVAQGLAALYIYQGNMGKLPKLLRCGDSLYRAYEKLPWHTWLYRGNDSTNSVQKAKVEQGLSWIQWGFYVWERHVTALQREFGGLLVVCISALPYCAEIDEARNIRC